MSSLKKISFGYDLDLLSPATAGWLSSLVRSWGSRPRLYAVARYRGLVEFSCAILGLTPRLYAIARYRGLVEFLR